MKKIAHWFDERTGYKKLVKELLYEPIPGGSRWRYVWGSTLVFAFATQVVTGLFLWMAYSPSSQTAWESVYYIQNEMQGGWLLRGIHHFTAQTMVVLLALHFMQVIIDGAYKAPREVNFWLGLILMQITLGLSLTGYLLPWDQKGYWATQVATKISSIVPVVGPAIQKLVVGGSNYGHHTLTRFFALHAGLLPALLIFFLVLHIYVFRRHGITVKKPDRGPTQAFWPDQVLKDGVACLGVLLVVLFLVGRHVPAHMNQLGSLAEEGRLGEVLGAELGAPADPADQYSAARPEWYFLFLFQFLKYFPRETEIYGAVVIPGGIVLVMLLMPFIGRWKLGHSFNVAYISALFVGVGALTWLAVAEDRNNEKYKTAVADAEIKATRVVELIRGQRGVGVTGARALLKNDPKTHGPEIFAQNCSQCHRFEGHDGTGTTVTETETASDLGKFGYREWIRGFVENPAGPKYFGPTAHGSFRGEPLGDRFTKGEMAKWAADNVPKMTQQEIDGVVEFLVAQSHRTDIPAPDPQLVAVGRRFFESGSKNATACADCHHLKIDLARYSDETLRQALRGPEKKPDAEAKNAPDAPEDKPQAAPDADSEKQSVVLGEPGGGAPELSGYGSEEWLTALLLNPGAENNYGERNAMPSYKDRMTDQDLAILIRWMRRRWYEPAGMGAE